MPMSVLTFWEGKVLGVGAVDLLVSAVAGVWSVGAQGLVSIGFDWFQCVRHQMLIEDGDFMPL
jgi:hypothetical protein